MSAPTEAMPLFAVKRGTAPVTEEVTVFDLPVSGAIPPELTGRYLRNGPNAKPRSAATHAFMQEGMVHGIRLENGAARWYRNRWVKTPRNVEGTSMRRADGSLDLSNGVANTNVIVHGGRTLALVESSYPWQLGDELETVGAYDFDGRLHAPFTAHPKVCPRTGELHAHGMSPRGGLTYLRMNAAGELVESRDIPVPGPTMMHDMAITERYVLFLDLPVVFDMARAMRGDMPYTWSDTYGARIGVMERGVENAPVRWFDIRPCYVFHVLNAFDAGTTVVLDALRYPELWRDTTAHFPSPVLYRWTLNLATGAVDERVLDERRAEFPRCDERRLGSAYRYGYAVETLAGGASGIVKYDVQNGTTAHFDPGAARAVGEAVFVPAESGTREDEGWLMTYIYDAPSDRSELAIVDASTMRTAATIALPQRVPFGFHGNWVAE